MLKDVTQWTSADGEYSIFLETGDGKFRFEAYRRGQRWRNLAGDQLMLALFSEVAEAKPPSPTDRPGTVP